MYSIPLLLLAIHLWLPPHNEVHAFSSFPSSSSSSSSWSSSSILCSLVTVQRGSHVGARYHNSKRTLAAFSPGTEGGSSSSSAKDDGPSNRPWGRLANLWKRRQDSPQQQHTPQRFRTNGRAAHADDAPGKAFLQSFTTMTTSRLLSFLDPQEEEDLEKHDEYASFMDHNGASGNDSEEEEDEENEFSVTHLHRHTADLSFGSRRRTFVPQSLDRQRRQTLPRYSFVLCMSSAESSSEDKEAAGTTTASTSEEAIQQQLFETYCDADGLMSKEALLTIPFIVELLSEGDLLLEEVEEMWLKIPKFPMQEDSTASSPLAERIDVDSFLQIYRDIDDLFEDEEEEELLTREAVVTTNGGATTTKSPPATQATQTVANNVADRENVASKKKDKGDDDKNDQDEEEVTRVRDEVDLEVAFASICDANGLVSQSALRNWIDVKELLAEGMLGQDEFQDLWDRTDKAPGSEGQLLDVEGFLSFNVALDELFVFEDADDDDDPSTTSSLKSPLPASKPPTKTPVKTTQDKNVADRDMIPADADLSPAQLFSKLASLSDSLVGWEELQRWGELQAMLEDGDLQPHEIKGLFAEAPKATSKSNRLNMDGFTALYNAIDDLFEDIDEEEEEEEEFRQVSQRATQSSSQKSSPAAKSKSKPKSVLLKLLAAMEASWEADDLLPCGLESTEGEDEQVAQAVEALEQDAAHNWMLSSSEDAVSEEKMAGEWELLYTSSPGLKFNKGLSGLGGTFPKGKFGGLRQVLQYTKFTSDMEYVERILLPAGASFDVTVTGDWTLRSSSSLFTGEPTLVLSLRPLFVKYGPTSTRADYWKSLGPMNLLDITYLDDNLRIMRGNPVDTIFVLRRVTSSSS